MRGNPATLELSLDINSNWYMSKDFYSASAWGASDLRTKIEQRENLAIEFMSQFAHQKSVKVLDLGCGDGCFLNALSERFSKWELSGADGSSAQVAKAKSRLMKSEFKVIDFNLDLPFSDAQFDIVFAGEIIEHLPDPDHFLKEAQRLLKRGGMICLTTPNLLAWYNRCLVFCGFSPIFIEYSTKDASVGYGWLKNIKGKIPVGHLRILQYDALKDLLEEAGFSLIKIKSARFEYLPSKMLWLDSLISSLWTRGGSVLIASAIKE